MAGSGIAPQRADIYNEDCRLTKPVYTLGISAFYHDSAAALLRDGAIIAAP